MPSIQNSPCTYLARRLTVVVQLIAAILIGSSVVKTTTQNAAQEPAHGKTVERLKITNAMVIYGNGRPPFGPVDIVVEAGLIRPGQLVAHVYPTL